MQGNGVAAWVPGGDRPVGGRLRRLVLHGGDGRLGPTARPEDAARDLRACRRAHRGAPPRVVHAGAAGAGHGHALWHGHRTADRRTPVLVALGAALLVLLVACANVANLVVARTTARERELSVRAALGAGRLRSARIVLAEVAVLAFAGALARPRPRLGREGGGRALVPRRARPTGGRRSTRAGAWGSRRSRRSPRSWPERSPPCRRRDAIRRARWPAAAAPPRGRRVWTRCRRRSPRCSSPWRPRVSRRVALLGRSLLEIAQVDPGFQTSHAMAFRVTAPPAAYPQDADVVRFFREARAALADVPGVAAVGFGSRLPLDGGDSRISVTPEGRTFAEDEARPVAWHRLVTPGYLEAMGAHLLEGRLPTRGRRPRRSPGAGGDQPCGRACLLARRIRRGQGVLRAGRQRLDAGRGGGGGRARERPDAPGAPGALHPAPRLALAYAVCRGALGPRRDGAPATAPAGGMVRLRRGADLAGDVAGACRGAGAPARRARSRSSRPWPAV